MAAAIQKLHPDAKFGVGPVVSDGFYYDIALPEAITPEQLKKIEKEMQKMQTEKVSYERSELDIDEAIALFENKNQPYKVELLNDLKKHGTTKASEIYGGAEADQEKADIKKVSIYTTGDFVDLCRGPHVDRANEIKAFKLLKIAGAYWRGDEKNTMMTRIYGTAFSEKKSLDAYLVMLEEAKKRDHKILGPKLDLFSFSELVGPGLPLWTPRGTVLRNVLDNFVWELREQRGYQKVEIPHITKKELFETSGHWDKFKNELFRITSREGHEFGMKPMNCPFHTQIYDRKQRSYRELPVRYANTTMCYRDEQTGELSGLSRLRAFTQDDAHVFCRKEHIEPEANMLWDIFNEFYSAFGFELTPRLSLSDPENMDAYLGERADWEWAEDALRTVIKSRGVEAQEQTGEAAFYGPKIDFVAKDSLGREWQVATIQLDFNMPERFDLNCTNEKGEDERIFMFHCAVMGSIERFLSVLIEHTSGDFPAWLAPTQVALLPVSAEKHLDFTRELAEKLKGLGVRVAIDDSDETVGKKIRSAEQMKMPYMLVIGDKEMGSDTLAVRKRGERDMVDMSIEELVKALERP